MRLVAILILSCSLFAQTPKLELKLGRLTVYLGESKTDFLREADAVNYASFDDYEILRDAAFFAPDFPPFSVGDKACNSHPFPRIGFKDCRFYGDIQFKNEKLKFAWREWSSEKPLVDVMNALDAVTKETHSCTINPPAEPIWVDHPDPPGRISRELYIKCGQRTVELWDLKEQDSSRPGGYLESFQVAEWIGDAGVEIELPKGWIPH